MPPNNRKLILKNALRLFSSRGYEAVGVQEICEAAQITKPTLYHYFGSKENLFQELMQTEYHKFNAHLQENTHYEANPRVYEKDVLPTLVRLVLAYGNYASQNQEFYRLMISLSFAPPESDVGKIVRDKNLKQYEIVTNLFQKISMQHGNLNKQENKLAVLFIGFINTQIALFFAGKAKLNEKEAHKTVQIFMHGIFSL